MRAVSAHDRVMVSWRFSSTRATCVQAASSALSMSAGTGARPIFSRASAACASARYSVPVQLQQLEHGLDLSSALGRRCSASCQTRASRSSGDAAAFAAARGRQGCVRLRRRSDRSAARAPVAECSSGCVPPHTPRGSAHRRPADWDAETTAATRRTGRGDTGFGPVSAT